MKKTVTLNPGESKAVVFEFTPTEARTYSVLVNGLTGNFRAIEWYPPAEELGMALRNAPPQSTMWRWTVRFDDSIKASYNTPIDEIAYARYPPVPLPNSLYQVLVWHMMNGEYLIDGEWIGEILISEYGTYEFDWNTHTLSRIG